MSAQAQLINQLQLLLKESVASAMHRSSETFDELTQNKRDIILFGVGNLGRSIACKLQQHPEINILGFADNNPKLWNSEYLGLKIYSPDDAALKFGKQAAFVVTIWNAGSTHRYKNTYQQLKNLGCDSVTSFIYLFWKYPKSFLPYYAVNTPQCALEAKEKILSLAESWQDITSLETYIEMIRWRLDGDFSKVAEPVASPQYFVDEIKQVNSQDVFFDVGAFDGDTLNYMLDRFQNDIPEIYCFEPDTINYQKLLVVKNNANSHQQLKIHTAHLAVTDHQGFLTFNSDGTASSALVAQGKDSVPCNSLDQYAENIVPTFIKMDIEGAEPQALSGCQKLIHSYQPSLAISAYHLQEHLWEIPLQILKLNSNYKLYLRAHNAECFDSICYATVAR